MSSPERLNDNGIHYEEISNLSFEELTSCFEFCNISYCVLPKNGLRNRMSGSRVSDRGMLNALNNFPFQYSSQASKEFFLDYRKFNLRQWKKLPEFIVNGSNWPEGFRYKTLESCEMKSNELLEIFSAHNVNTFAEYYSTRFNDLCGVFYFTSQHDLGLVQGRLEAPAISRFLDLIHYFQIHNFPLLTNPNLYDGSLQDKTVKVLALTASGLSSKKISEELFLSERGVNYHLDKVKDMLGARNKAEMLYLAKRLCII